MGKLGQKQEAKDKCQRPVLELCRGAEAKTLKCNGKGKQERRAPRAAREPPAGGRLELHKNRKAKATGQRRATPAVSATVHGAKAETSEILQKEKQEHGVLGSTGRKRAPIRLQ